MPETPDPSDSAAGNKLGFWQQIVYAAGNLPVGFSPTVLAAWLPYYFYGRVDEGGQPIVYVSTATFGTIWFLCNALNGITDPVVGYLSDHTRSRWGRRRPWVILGAPLLAISFFFLWTPVTPGPSMANNAVLFVALFLFWFSFTVVVAPYLSLLPEITPFNKERVRISTFMGLFEVLGTVLGSALWPTLTGLAAGGLLFMATGEQVIAFASGIVLLIVVTLAVLAVRESRPPESAISKGGGSTFSRAIREFISTFNNKPFVPYVIGVGFYRMAIATTVFIAPFLATKVLAAYSMTSSELWFLSGLGALGEDGATINWEAAAGLMMALVLLGAALFFPLTSWLATRLGKRFLFIMALSWFGIIMIAMAFVGELPLVPPLFQALALFGLAAFPVSIAMVVMRPLLADVIDADEGLTGERREGVYNGMEGLIMKVAAGLGPLIGGVLFAWLGQTPEHNLGVRLCAPLAGICLLAAAAAFTRYPIRK